MPIYQRTPVVGAEMFLRLSELVIRTCDGANTPKHPRLPKYSNKANSRVLRKTRLVSDASPSESGTARRQQDERRFLSQPPARHPARVPQPEQ